MHCNLEPSHFYFDGSIYDKSLNPVFWYAERTGDEIILSEILCKVKCKIQSKMHLAECSQIRQRIWNS